MENYLFKRKWLLFSHVNKEQYVHGVPLMKQELNKRGFKTDNT